MAKAQFVITLRGGEEERGRMRYEPGQVMQGSVQVIPEKDMRCDHLYARLSWHTEGRGDRDQAMIAEMDLFQGDLREATPTYHTFHFTLPHEPWSFAGYYINIIWEFEVSVDVPMAKDPKQSQPFIMAPRRD
jgi:hypothetical protein